MTCDANQKSVTNADLTINGEKIELNSFVESFISQSIIGMVKSLKGVSHIETINLKISTKSEESQTTKIASCGNNRERDGQTG